MAATVCVVVGFSTGSTERGLIDTLKSLRDQERTEEQFSVVIWSTVDGLLLETVQQVMRIDRIICQNEQFFCDIPLSLNELKDQSFSSLLYCTSGVVLKPSFFSFLLQKRSEYSEGQSLSVLSSVGVRLFPHHKITDGLLQDGLHYKVYGESATDRAVHIFSTELCLISRDILTGVGEQWSDKRLGQLGHLWCSFLIGHRLNHSVWKIKTAGEADLTPVKQQPLYESNELFNDFYSTICSHDWPLGINRPFHSEEHVETKSALSPLEIWDRGFGGVNMSSEPASELDFTALSAYGAKVIRIGAVADAQDLNYLLNKQARDFEEDSQHLLQVIPRLRRALIRISNHGLKAMITLTDLPGSTFQSGPSMEFWESDCARIRAAKFWGLIAQNLIDLSHSIMGYDLINEPYFPQDDIDYFEEISSDYNEQLNHFYSEAIHEIRTHDDKVMIILSSLAYASPRAIPLLRPYKDTNIAYSFHMYALPILTLRHLRIHGEVYPGAVRKWMNCPYDMIDVSYEFLYSLLKETVYQWQVKNGVASNRILVGEFGISREVPGANCYLRDSLRIFSEFGWSWLLFSFRDEEWDSLDYELGPDIDNMLYRSSTELFMTVAKHFY